MFDSATALLVRTSDPTFFITAPFALQVAKFGYDTGNYQDALKQVTQSDPSARGQIQSGRYGQGVFPITFMTMTVATLIWITHVVSRGERNSPTPCPFAATES